MNPDPLRIRLLKTHYPHWGSHTAFNAMLPHFPASLRVAMREASLPRRPPSTAERWLRPWLRRQGLAEYSLADLRAEAALFFSALFSPADIVMFLDAEHSLLFLPRWLRRARALRRPPRIVAMFHQPPAVLERIINIDVALQADHVVAVSPVQAEFFSRFIPADRLSTILLGVDTAHFRPGRAAPPPGRLQCLGGGVWLRDYEALFRTAELLAGSPEIEFHVVASSLALPAGAKNVFIHRSISDAELLELYQGSHVLFLPLKDATANTFLMEGCACGLPVVSSDLPSLRAYFPGGEAILVKDNDPRAFAEALRGLHRDPESRAAMSVLARRRALQLSWERIVPEYARLFQKLARSAEMGKGIRSDGGMKGD